MYQLVLQACLLFVLFAGLFVPPTQAQQMIIIGNDNGPPQHMKMQEVRSVFKAHQKWWPNDTKISLALLKSSSPLAGQIAKEVFEMSVADVKKYWVQIVFQGKASPPKHFETEEEIVRYVAQTPGAIGIVGAGAELQAVKKVRVDGAETF